jgi:hypothetical protein
MLLMRVISPTARIASSQLAESEFAPYGKTASLAFPVRKLHTFPVHLTLT